MGPLLLPAVQEMQGWSRSTGVGVVWGRGIRSNQRLKRQEQLAGIHGVLLQCKYNSWGSSPRIPMPTSSLFRLLEAPNPDFSLGRQSTNFFKPLLPSLH